MSGMILLILPDEAQVTTEMENELDLIFEEIRETVAKIANLPTSFFEIRLNFETWKVVTRTPQIYLPEVGLPTEVRDRTIRFILGDKKVESQIVDYRVRARGEVREVDLFLMPCFGNTIRRLFRNTTEGSFWWAETEIKDGLSIRKVPEKIAEPTIIG